MGPTLKHARQKLGTRPDTPVQPMSEEIIKREYMHFTDADKALIAQRREERMVKGMTDTAIGASLAGEMGRSGGKITSCIKRMVREHTLMKNPSLRTWNRFSDAEKKELAKVAGEMAAQGKNDTQIADELAGRTGRSMDSIHACMRRMVLAGELGKNPKIGCRRYLPQEDELIIRRRTQLAAKGASDKRIGKELAVEMKRSADGIAFRIRRMIKAGKLERNMNHVARKLSETDKLLISKMRAELIPKGMNDHQIAHVLARRIGKKQTCIRGYIYHMAEDGVLPENPNKREIRHFSAATRKRIEKRREELIDEGQTDNKIAHVIAGEIHRDWECVVQCIEDMVKKGTLRENPNKRINTRWDVTHL